MKSGNAIILLLSVFLTVLFSGAAMRTAPAVRSADSVVVVVDAGHGGVDGGVTGVKTGVKESDVNLAVAKTLKEKLEAGGITVVMTRTTPAALYGGLSDGFKRKDLQKRVELTKKSNADLFISIHANKYKDNSRRGAQVFYKINDEKSKNFASHVQKNLNEMPRAARECTFLQGDYYVLNENDVPSIICECGFLSNENDEKLLLDETYRDELSYAIYKGVIDYFSAS